MTHPASRKKEKCDGKRRGLRQSSGLGQRDQEPCRWEYGMAPACPPAVPRGSPGRAVGACEGASSQERVGSCSHQNLAVGSREEISSVMYGIPLRSSLRG